MATFRYVRRVVGHLLVVAENRWRSLVRSCVGACGLWLVFGCQSYGDQLQRAQSYYERNQYELALAVVRNLEADQDSLSENEMVRYCYVRGMTDYRLGFKEDARYWLGLAKAASKASPVALQQEEQTRVEETLAELNGPIFGLTAADSAP